MSKMTLEENTIFAENVLAPLLSIIDAACFSYGQNKLHETLSAMRDQTSTLAAWPFPETMEQAETNQHKVELFKKVIELIELRQRQRLTHPGIKGSEAGKALREAVRKAYELDEYIDSRSREELIKEIARLEDGAERHQNAAAIIHNLLEALDATDGCDCGGSSLCAVCSAHDFLEQLPGGSNDAR